MNPSLELTEISSSSLCACIFNSMATSYSASFSFQSLCVLCCVTGLWLSGSHLLLSCLLNLNFIDYQRAWGRQQQWGFFHWFGSLGFQPLCVQDTMRKLILKFNNELRDYEKKSLPKPKTTQSLWKAQECLLCELKQPKWWTNAILEKEASLMEDLNQFLRARSGGHYP